jgi:Flp pilus assembly protein TadD
MSPRILRPTLLALALSLTGAGASPPTPERKPALGDYLRAVVALQGSDYPFAAEHLLRALAADPGNRSLRQQTFLAVALAGRPEASRIASGLPNEPAPIMLLGNEAAIAGRWSDAERIFAGLPHDGGLADALRPALVAWALQGEGRTDQALQTLAPLVEGDRLPGYFALNAGLIADLAGRDAEAGNEYHLAQTGAAGLNLSLVRVIASYAARHGHAADGAALVHALVAAAPSLAIAETGIDATLDVRPVANARDGLARAYAGAASLLTAQAQKEAPPDKPAAGSTTALLMLRFSETLAPGSSETRLMIADADQALKALQPALDVLAPIPASDPLAPIAQLREAELLRALGRDDDARAKLSSLSRAFPHQPEPPRELGEMFSDEKRYREAADQFDRAIADIGQPTGDDWELFFDRAIAFDRSGQWNRADSDLHRALSLSPEQPYVLNYLGYSYAEQGRDLDDARHMLERSLDQKPNDGAFLDSLGWIILKQGHVPAAIDTLEHAAEITPEDATVNYHLGVAYWQAGRKAEAQQQWERALILNPDPNDLPKIEARLHEAALGSPPPSP